MQTRTERTKVYGDWGQLQGILVYNYVGMQDELIATFNNFNDAVDMANSETYLDEMHDGYVVRSF